MVQEKKHLNVSFEKQSFHEDDKFYFFSGYASTFGNVDLGGDIVMPGAFRESLVSKMPKLLYQHRMIYPLGIINRAHEDSKGLFVEGKMPKANSMCSDVASLIECGAIDSFSIGYSINIDGSEVNESGNLLLRSLDLMEVSFVTIPMNGEARINDFKSIEGLKSIRDVEALLKETGIFSQKESKGIISKIKEFSDHRDDDSQEALKAKRDAEVANEKEAIVNCLKNINSQLTQIL